MVKYIINKEVIFFPGKKQLLSIKDGTRFTILTSSAQCLELLLERQGQLVSHSELMIAGWGENAKRTVSNPAYYQSFVNLRNIFKKMNCPDNILITIRGKGIRLNAYIPVEKHDDDLQKNIKIVHTVTEDPDTFPAEPIFNEKAAEHSLMKGDESSNVIQAIERLKKEQQAKQAKQKSIKFYTYSLATAFFFISALACFLYFHMFEDEIMIEGYSHVRGTPLCYLVNNRNINNHFALDFVHDKNLECQGDVKYYISYFSTTPRLTVFMCGKASSLKCDSITYILDNHEKN